MTVTVADIIRIMETLAPSRLAETWDNAGLQVGRKDWPVRRVWVALDPTPDVMAAASEKGADLLITHHPLIFKPLKSVDFSTPAGSIILMASQHQMAIFSAHTNLDNVAGGVNDVLASKIGLKNLEILGKAMEPEICKLVVYVPAEYEQKILNALFETSAGSIGEYSCCSFRNRGKGTFRPGPLAKPFAGEAGKISHADEVRIETVVAQNDVTRVTEYIKDIHPYETMAYDVYPIQNSEFRIPDSNRIQGLGRIGELDEKMDLASFALKIKEILGLESVKVAGKPDLPVTRAALCTGSGSSLMNIFFSSGAEVYISGDLRYHDARDAEAQGRGLIDIGHFASEFMIVEVLADRLGKILHEAGMDVTVEACRLEEEPFVSV